MMEQDTSSELMNKLFIRNQCNVLRDIFLYLDPISLKNCKLVNSNWCNFIDENLWGSKTGRRELERRLVSQWKDKDNKAVEKLFDIGHNIRSTACDDEIAVLGFNNGKAGVLNILSGELLSEMDCSGERYVFIYILI